MSRLIATLSCLLAILLSGSSARADGPYFQESVGASVIGDQLGDLYSGNVFLKIGAGAHVDQWSGEIFFAANFLQPKAQMGKSYSTGSTASLLRYGAEARYFIPRGEHLRLYMRGGLSKNYLTGSTSHADMSGRGVDYGAGAMLSTKVRALGFLFWPGFFTGFGPKISASVWADAGGHFARLRDERLNTLDVRTASWSLGFTVGGGF